MRKLLVIVCCALGAVLLTPTAAGATTTQTLHVNGVPIDVGPSGCFAADLVITGNAVLHTTTNNAGDFWLTETVEGSATVTVAGSTLFSGHAAAWFGLEFNAQNFVAPHFTANAVGTLADGTSVRIHQEGQFTVNAQGVPTVSRVTATCT
jgi:hypothetical protein